MAIVELVCMLGLWAPQSGGDFAQELHGARLATLEPVPRSARRLRDPAGPDDDDDVIFHICR